MKIKDFDYIRRLELISNIFLGISVYGFNINELETIQLIFQLLHTVDIFTMSRSIKISSDYRELESMYHEVINNSTNLVNNLEIKHPIEIFTMYIYLYRNGYLSYNNHFEYSSKMKDLPGLMGMDVILGNGVCRSLSAMLVDIYNNLGFNSTNLLVRINSETFSESEELSDIKMESTKGGIILANLAFIFTSIFRAIGNHQILTINDGKFNYILDPTNDRFLHYKNEKNKLYISSSDNYLDLTPFSQIVLGLDKMDNYDIHLSKLRKTFKLEQISTEEYNRIYLETLKLCKHCITYFKDFYEENKNLYKDIYFLASEQRNLIGRMFPLTPKNKILIKK